MINLFILVTHTFDDLLLVLWEIRCLSPSTIMNGEITRHTCVPRNKSQDLKCSSTTSTNVESFGHNIKRLFDTANILTHSVVHVECITALGSRFAVCYPFLYADLQLFWVFLVRSERLIRQDKNHQRRYNSTDNTHSISLDDKKTSFNKKRGEIIAARMDSFSKRNSHASGLKAQKAGVVWALL